MSWRNFQNHRDETRAVKQALTKARIPFSKIGHGRGTGWAWLEIYLGNRETYQRYADKVLRIAQDVTGRTGDYNGEILILAQ